MDTSEQELEKNDDPEDVDIYGDIPDFDLGEEIERLKNENGKLEERICTLHAEIRNLNNKIEELKEDRNNLSKNISSLYVTSKAEIERKNRMIQELREKIEGNHGSKYNPNFNKRKEREISSSETNKAKKFKGDDSTEKDMKSGEKQECTLKYTDKHKCTKNDIKQQYRSEQLSDNEVKIIDVSENESRSGKKQECKPKCSTDRHKRTKDDNKRTPSQHPDDSDVEIIDNTLDNESKSGQKEECKSKYSIDRKKCTKDDKQYQAQQPSDSGVEIDNVVDNELKSGERQEYATDRPKYSTDRQRYAENDYTHRHRHQSYNERYRDDRYESRFRYRNERYNSDNRFNSRNKNYDNKYSICDDDRGFSVNRRERHYDEAEDRYDSRRRFFSDRYSRISRHGSRDRSEADDEVERRGYKRNNRGYIRSDREENKDETESSDKYGDIKSSNHSDSDYFNDERRPSERLHPAEFTSEIKDYATWRKYQQTLADSKKPEEQEHSDSGGRRSITPVPSFEEMEDEVKVKPPKKKLKMLEKMEKKIKQKRLSHAGNSAFDPRECALSETNKLKSSLSISVNYDSDKLSVASSKSSKSDLGSSETQGLKLENKSKVKKQKVSHESNLNVTKSTAKLESKEINEAGVGGDVIRGTGFSEKLEESKKQFLPSTPKKDKLKSEKRSVDKVTKLVDTKIKSASSDVKMLSDGVSKKSSRIEDVTKKKDDHENNADKKSTVGTSEKSGKEEEHKEKDIKGFEYKKNVDGEEKEIEAEGDVKLKKKDGEKGNEMSNLKVKIVSPNDDIKQNEVIKNKASSLDMKNEKKIKDSKKSDESERNKKETSGDASSTKKDSSEEINPKVSHHSNLNVKKSATKLESEIHQSKMRINTVANIEMDLKNVKEELSTSNDTKEIAQSGRETSSQSKQMNEADLSDVIRGTGVSEKLEEGKKQIPKHLSSMQESTPKKEKSKRSSVDKVTELEDSKIKSASSDAKKLSDVPVSKKSLRIEDNPKNKSDRKNTIGTSEESGKEKEHTEKAIKGFECKKDVDRGEEEEIEAEAEVKLKKEDKEKCNEKSNLKVKIVSPNDDIKENKVVKNKASSSDIKNEKKIKDSKKSDESERNKKETSDDTNSTKTDSSKEINPKVSHKSNLNVIKSATKLESESNQSKIMITTVADKEMDLEKVKESLNTSNDTKKMAQSGRETSSQSKQMNEADLSGDEIRGTGVSEKLEDKKQIPKYLSSMLESTPKKEKSKSKRSSVDKVTELEDSKIKSPSNNAKKLPDEPVSKKSLRMEYIMEKEHNTKNKTDRKNTVDTSAKSTKEKEDKEKVIKGFEYKKDVRAVDRGEEGKIETEAEVKLKKEDEVKYNQESNLKVKIVSPHDDIEEIKVVKNKATSLDMKNEKKIKDGKRTHESDINKNETSGDTNSTKKDSSEEINPKVSHKIDLNDTKLAAKLEPEHNELKMMITTVADTEMDLKKIKEELNTSNDTKKMAQSGRETSSQSKQMNEADVSGDVVSGTSFSEKLEEDKKEIPKFSSSLQESTPKKEKSKSRKSSVDKVTKLEDSKIKSASSDAKKRSDEPTSKKSLRMEDITKKEDDPKCKTDRKNTVDIDTSEKSSKEKEYKENVIKGFEYKKDGTTIDQGDDERIEEEAEVKLKKKDEGKCNQESCLKVKIVSPNDYTKENEDLKNKSSSLVMKNEKKIKEGKKSDESERNKNEASGDKNSTKKDSPKEIKKSVKYSVEQSEQDIKETEKEEVSNTDNKNTNEREGTRRDNEPSNKTENENQTMVHQKNSQTAKEKQDEICERITKKLERLFSGEDESEKLVQKECHQKGSERENTAKPENKQKGFRVQDLENKENSTVLQGQSTCIEQDNDKLNEYSAKENKEMRKDKQKNTETEQMELKNMKEFSSKQDSPKSAENTHRMTGSKLNILEADTSQQNDSKELNETDSPDIHKKSKPPSNSDVERSFDTLDTSQSSKSEESANSDTSSTSDTDSDSPKSGVHKSQVEKSSSSSSSDSNSDSSNSTSENDESFDDSVITEIKDVLQESSTRLTPEASDPSAKDDTTVICNTIIENRVEEQITSCIEEFTTNDENKNSSKSDCVGENNVSKKQDIEECQEKRVMKEENKSKTIKSKVNILEVITIKPTPKMLKSNLGKRLTASSANTSVASEKTPKPIPNIPETKVEKSLTPSSAKTSAASEKTPKPSLASLNTNASSTKLVEKKRITPILINDEAPCTFQNILTKPYQANPFSSPKEIMISPLHLTHEGEIPILHLEENHINNMPTEMNINDKNIMNLLDSMNISNIDCDIPKFKSGSTENTVLSAGASSDRGLTFENIIGKASSTPSDKENVGGSVKNCQSSATPEVASASSSYNLDSSAQSSSSTTPFRSRRRRCRLVIRD